VSTSNTWIGGGLPNATAWDQANNWGSGHAPISTDDIVINAGANQPIISDANNNTTINSLTANNDATLTFNVTHDVLTLTIIGSLVSDGSLSSTVGNGGAQIVTEGIGGITNNANGTITHLSLDSQQSGILNNGTITDSYLQADDSGSIVNSATGMITNTNISTSGNITNNGSIIQTTDAATTEVYAGLGSLTNNGLIIQVSEVYAFDGLTNNGSITCHGGHIDGYAGIANTDSISGYGL
jgi:hypothetical protein